MRIRQGIAIKFIVACGIATFVLLFLAGEAMRRYSESMQTKKRMVAPSVGVPRLPEPRLTDPAYRLDAARVSADLAAIDAVLEQSSGDPLAFGTFVSDAFEQAGLQVLRTWQTLNRDGTDPGAREVIGIVKGTSPQMVVLGARGRMGAALLLDIARAVGPAREGRTLWLWFFAEPGGADAADFKGHIDSMADVLTRTNQMKRVEAAILAPRLGNGPVASLPGDMPSHWLSDALRAKAVALGYEAEWTSAGGLSEDCAALTAAGVPSVVLACGDENGAACPRSLQAAGDVIYHSLSDLDVYLGKREPERRLSP